MLVPLSLSATTYCAYLFEYAPWPRAPRRDHVAADAVSRDRDQFRIRSRERRRIPRERLERRHGFATSGREPGRRKTTTSTGSVLPFRASVRRWSPGSSPAASAPAAVTRASPAAATDESRAVTLTMSPIAVSSVSS